MSMLKVEEPMKNGYVRGFESDFGFIAVHAVRQNVFVKLSDICTANTKAPNISQSITKASRNPFVLEAAIPVFGFKITYACTYGETYCVGNFIIVSSSQFVVKVSISAAYVKVSPSPQTHFTDRIS